MAKLKKPLFSLDARNSLSKAITFVKRRGQNIAEARPVPPDAKSLAQLSWRHMYQKGVALWHALSAAEKQDWESQARSRHMTGFAWFMSQVLKPNPGLYLPLQGGIMQGIIDMDGYQIEDLKDPVAGQDGDTKAARDAAIAAAIGGSLTCDIHGYDGFNWQKLLVESAAQHNLRVKLYIGATGIEAEYLNTDLTNEYGLIVKAQLLAKIAPTNFDALEMGIVNIDSVAAGTKALWASSFPYGFNGATWDRLRTYPAGILKVGRAEIDSTTLRKTVAGQVVAGARKLFWVACSGRGMAAIGCHRRRGRCRL